jgi:hypothetical protein
MRRLGLFIATACVAVLGAAGYASAAAGPVAHWRFDESSGQSAADASGNGNAGTLEGGVTRIAGKRLGAIQFDGSTGRVRVPSSSSLEPANVSISAWVRRSGNPGDFRYIVGKGAYGCVAASYGLYTGPNGGLMFYVSDGADYARSADAGALAWDGAWHHVAGTFDGQFLRLYVDGTEIGAPTPRSAPLTYAFQNPVDLLLGDYAGCGGLAFDGALDEAKIWNRALTPAEVVADTRWFDFKGFYAPVDNQPTLNVVKAGAAVPLKWSLSGYQGMDILATGSPSSRSVACDSSLPPDELELTATPGSSGLAYDATADRYSYVWKTEKSWTGCRELMLRLSDGSVHTAAFRFK